MAYVSKSQFLIARAAIRKSAHARLPEFGTTDDSFDPLLQRQYEAEHIKSCAYNGYIRLLIEGTDCDGSYHEQTCYLRASVTMYNHFLRNREKWSDGVDYYTILRIHPRHVEDFEAWLEPARRLNLQRAF